MEFVLVEFLRIDTIIAKLTDLANESRGVENRKYYL